MDSFHHWLIKLHMTFGKSIFASAQKMGLTSGQPKILEFLDEVGSAEQKTIARFAKLNLQRSGEYSSAWKKADWLPAQERKAIAGPLLSS